MSQPIPKPGDPLMIFHYGDITRPIYKFPAFIEVPSAPASHQHRPRVVNYGDGVWKAHRSKKSRLRQGTSEAGSGSRGSRAGIDDSSRRGPSDGLMRSEERLKEAEEEAQTRQIRLAVLKHFGAPQPKERECSIPPPRYMRGSHELNMRGVPRDRAARRSGNRRSRHRHSSRCIHTERYNTLRRGRPAFYYERPGQPQAPEPAGPTAVPRPSHASGRVQRDQACDRGRALMMLPLFQSPSSRTSLPVRSRQNLQGSNEDGKRHGTGDVSATSDGKTEFNDADNKAETQSASIASDVDLDIRISYEDSSEETQTRNDPCATPLEPLAEYVLANEEDYLADDDSESPCATSLEPPDEYVLANEEDYLVKAHSDCEDEV